MLAGEELSFLFIDGLHSYTDIAADIAAYLPLVKSNGIIAFHDYEPKGTFGVKQAVDESISRGEMRAVISSNLFVARKI